MDGFKSSTQQAVEHYLSGDYKRALKTVKGFRIGITKHEREAMTRAYECMVHPEFYIKIGINIDEAIEIGLEIFKSLFIK